MATGWRFIKHPLHGILDLLVDVSLAGIAVVAWSSGASAAAVALPAFIGVANLTYSALTTYALGRRHLLSFPTHLALDALAGVALVGGAVWLPETDLYRGVVAAMGLGILAAVAVTDPEVGDIEGR